MITNIQVRTAIALLLAAIVSGCVPATQTGTSYSRDEVRTVQDVKLGTVIDAVPVKIEGTNSGAGGAVGGAIGGLAGSTVDDGTTADIAAVVAGAAGAIIGAKTEDALTRANGTEYTIRLEDGELISVVQANDKHAEPIRAGDRVKLLAQSGTYRVSKLGALAP